MITNDVPCNGCVLCCKSDIIRLLSEDKPDEYDTISHPLLKGQLMLNHKDNGDCVYLRSYGCSINNRKPQMCREMDCRIIAQNMTFFKAHRLGNEKIWKRGKELLQQKC